MFLFDADPADCAKFKDELLLLVDIFSSFSFEFSTSKNNRKKFQKLY